MSCTQTNTCTCGCCSGTSVETPAGEANLPGLASIAYRTGTWTTFRQSMLARLSSSDYPALSYLKTRDGDDFGIALVDAASVMLDILTFYQERLANESYLRTATQLWSLIELGRLIGYQPKPGVASSTYLAFTLKAAPGLPPDPSTPAITIPAGTQVQSAPAQGQQPQTFETSADILAKADWNQLAVETGKPWAPPGHHGIYLTGTALQLNPGDSLLILGANRENWQASCTPNEEWEVVVINQVLADTTRNLTWVGWNSPLVHTTNGTGANWVTAKVFAFRQKASLFGNSAPDPNQFTNANSPTTTSLPNLITVPMSSASWFWTLSFTIRDSSHIDLNTTLPKVATGSWFALVSNGQAQLYKVVGARTVSLAQWTLSAKVTELAADFADAGIQSFPLQGANATEVWAQSEELTIAEQPLDHPLYGTLLDLETLRPDLIGLKAVAITGNAQKLKVKSGLANTLVFTPDDNSPTLTLKPGDVITVLDPASLPLKKKSGAVPHWKNNTDSLDLRAVDASGRTGTIDSAMLANFSLVQAGKSDPVVEEAALVSRVVEETEPFPHTRLVLASPLLHCYDRAATTVNANVGLATNGASVSEILGSGSASTPNQRFSLKQFPLTFTTNPNISGGRQSTLKLIANQAAWTEVPTLYQQPPTAQVFSTLNRTGGHTDILTGDGVEGAMLPTGTNNIRADYRVGSGVAGNVGAGAITTLMDRPLGVSGVFNPMPATGGQDPQSIDDIRTNAPFSVLTLGRAVSITDYQNYAAGYAGIAKANAIWIGTGPGRGVFLTVAAAGGLELAPDDPTLTSLVDSLHNFGNPLIPIHAASFLETLFSVEVDLKVDPAYDKAAVKDAVLAALRTEYSFANRGFGQGVSADEIAALAQAIAGVVAVNVKNLAAGLTSSGGDIAGSVWSVNTFTNWIMQKVTLTRPCSASPARICPYLPQARTTALPYPAEILVLDPNPANVVLGDMA